MIQKNQVLVFKDLYKSKLKWFNIFDDALILIYETNRIPQMNVVFITQFT